MPPWSSSDPSRLGPSPPPVSLAFRLHRLVNAHVDARPVALARIVIGVAVLLKLAGGIRLLTRLTEPTTIKLPMLAWLPAPTPAMVTLLLVLWGVGGTCFLIGWRTRSAGVLLTLVFAVQLVLDQQTYSNHLYLLALVIGWLTVADSGAAWSVDRAAGLGPRSRRGPCFCFRHRRASSTPTPPCRRSRRTTSPAWPWHPSYTFRPGSDSSGFLPPPPSCCSMSWAAIPLEAVLAIFLWSPRHRAAVALLGVVLHAGMVALIYRMRLDLTVFAFVMWGLYLLFLGPAIVPVLERRGGRSSHRP